MKNTLKTLALASSLTLGLIGCSPETMDEYHVKIDNEKIDYRNTSSN